MATYKVKNLSKNSPTEIRIFSANDLNVVGSNTDFTNLDISEKNIGVILKPDYSVNCNGAINYAGILDSNITSGTVIANIDGVKTLVSTDAELINILNTNFGLDAHIFEDYVPPAPKTDNEMYFTTLASSATYVGNVGDKIVLSNGTIIDVTTTNEEVIFTTPAGTHKVVLADVVDRNDYVSIAGEALIELVNFPTLASINKFNFAAISGIIAPNLVKVPTTLPSHITDLSFMFYGAIVFNQLISSWNVSNVTNMKAMFANALGFNQDISSWDTSNVTDMSYMFATATSFNQDISSWDTSNVTDMSYMFGKVATIHTMNFNQDISQWCVGLITDEPTGFNIDGILQSNYKPVWGTCPRGENQNQPQ